MREPIDWSFGALLHAEEIDGCVHVLYSDLSFTMHFDTKSQARAVAEAMMRERPCAAVQIYMEDPRD